MKRILASLSAVAGALLLALALPTAASANEIILDGGSSGVEKSNYVDDSAGVLTKGDIETINAAADRIRDTYGVAIAAEFRNGTDDLPIDEYATQRAGSLGLGDSESNNGLFYVVDMESRDYYVAKGDGVGAVINNDELQSILDDSLAPALSGGEYAKGIVDSATVVGKIYSGEDKSQFIATPPDGGEGEFVEPSNDGSGAGAIVGAITVAVLFVGGILGYTVYQNVGTRRIERSKRAADSILRSASADGSIAKYREAKTREGRMEFLAPHTPDGVRLEQLERDLNIAIARSELGTDYINVHSTETVDDAITNAKRIAEDKKKGVDIWGKMSSDEKAAYKSLRGDEERRTYLKSLGYGPEANILVMMALFGTFGILTNQSIAHAEALRQQQSMAHQSNFGGLNSNSSLTSTNSSHFGGGSFGGGGGAGGSF